MDLAFFMGRAVLICKLCLRPTAALVRCHIYPRSRSREIAGVGPLVSLARRNESTQVGRADGGLYDRGIVCGQCEKSFKSADDYAIEFRRKALFLTGPCDFPLKQLAFPSFQADAALLHAFAVTTLVRASLSDRWEHEHTRDRELEAVARRSLLHGVPTIECGREVCFVVTRGELGKIMAAPVLHPLDTYPVYRLQMPNFTAFVAASDNGLMPGFKNIALREGKPVLIWRRRRPMDFELQDVGQRFEAVGDRLDRIMRRSA